MRARRMKGHHHHFGIRQAALRCGLVTALLGATAAPADDRTWNGGGTDNDWTTDENWGTETVAAGDSLFFGGATRLAPNNNFDADTAFAGLTFNSGAGAFVLGGASITLDGNVVNAAANNQTIALNMILGTTRAFGVNAEGNLTVNGLLSGDGGLTKTGTGAGALILGGANSYTGITTIAAGTLKLGVAGGIPPGSDKLVVASGATLDVNGMTFSRGTSGDYGQLEIAGVGVGGLGAIRSEVASTVRYQTLSLSDDATIRAQTGQLSIHYGYLDLGGNTLTKTGNHTINFRYYAVSTPGDILISAGTIRLEDADFYSATPVTISVASGARLDYWDMNTVVNNQNIALTGGYLSLSSASTTLSGTITLNAGNNEIGNHYSDSRIFTLTGKITGTGGFSLRQNTTVTATVALKNSGNDYAGNTRIPKMCILQLGANNVIPDGSGKGNLTIDPDAAAGGILDLRGYSETINGLSGTSGTVPGRVINSLATSTGTLTVGGGDVSSTFSGLILNNTGSGGTVALGKTGDGTFTLTGANSYSGGTTVDGGILAVSNATGSATGSGTVTVNVGGTVMGTGVIAGGVAANGGTLAPGGSIGTLTVGSLSMSNSAVLAVEIAGLQAGTEHDQVVVTDGAVTLDGTPTLEVTLGYAPSLGDTFTVVDNAAGLPIQGLFADGHSIAASFAGKPYKLAISYLGGSGNDLVLEVVPRGTMIVVR